MVRAFANPSSSKPGRHPEVVAFALVFLLTTSLLIFRNLLAAPTTTFNEQYRMAQYVVHGTGFSCPVGPERHDPSSWYAPGYVYLMAGVLALFGEASRTSLAVIRMLNVLATSLALALYFGLARRLFGGAVAWVALVLALLSPLLIVKAGEIWDTAWCMLSGAALLSLFIFARLEGAGPRLLAGLACGAASLINPSFSLCYPVWVAFAWHRTHGRRRGLLGLLRFAAPIALAFVLAILPWTIRNVRTFDAVFYLRGNLPLELWVGNAPWAEGDMSSTDGRLVHPVFDRDEAARMVRLGEYGYFQACRADVARWWREDPGRFLRLTLRRIRYFWTGRSQPEDSAVRRLGRYASLGGSAILALAGSVLILFRYRNAVILVATLGVFPLSYYATLILPRYRVPIEPLVLTVAAVALCEPFRQRMRGGDTRAKSP